MLWHRGSLIAVTAVVLQSPIAQAYDSNRTSDVPLHPLAFDMPYSSDDTGIVPEEMLLALSGSQAASESDELLVDSEVTSARPNSQWSCSGYRRRMFKNHMHVYNMKFSVDPEGVKDRDAASLYGIQELLTGRDPSLPKSEGVSVAWGLNRYYKAGVMQVVYVSYTSFGPYQSCNALQPGVPGSPHHCIPCLTPAACCCSTRTANASSSIGPLVGQLKESYTGGEWYSFNGLGLGTTWHQFECPTASAKVKDLADKLATAGKCGSCEADLKKCAECIRKIPHDTVTKIYHELFNIGEEDSLIV